MMTKSWQQKTRSGRIKVDNMWTKKWEFKIEDMRHRSRQAAVYRKVKRIIKKYAKKKHLHVEMLSPPYTVVMAGDYNADPAARGGNGVFSVCVRMHDITATLHYYPDENEPLEIISSRAICFSNANKKALIKTYNDMFDSIMSLMRGEWA